MKSLLTSAIPLGIMMISYLCVFLAVFLFKRSKRNRRSPISGKLLRSPGQSILPQIEETTDQIMEALFGLAVFPLLVLSVAAMEVFSKGELPSFLTLAVYSFFLGGIIPFFATRLKPS